MQIAETRFGGHLKPLVSEEAARAALLEAGCDQGSIADEVRRKGR